METMNPGRSARIAGTLATFVGVVVILYNWETPDYENGFFAGALLVIGGLLLRIEGTIAGAVRRKSGSEG